MRRSVIVSIVVVVSVIAAQTQLFGSDGKANDNGANTSVSPRIATVLILLDASKAMSRRFDATKSRMVAAEDMIKTLVNCVPPSVKLGIRIFGQNAPTNSIGVDCEQTEVKVAPESDKKLAIVNSLATLQPKGVSNLIFGIYNSLQDAKLLNGNTLVVVFTDSVDECNGNSSSVIRWLSPNISLSIVSLCQGPGESIALYQQREIAELCHGKFYTRETFSELIQELRNLR
jgi:hypothetical protein